MAQFAQDLGLDLADALAGDFELVGHFFERALFAVGQAVAQFDDAALAVVQV